MQALRNLKTYFFRGLAALLPTILTVWIFVQLYFFLQQNISSYINRGVVRILVYSNSGYPYISDDDLLVYVKNNFPAADDEQLLQEKVQDPAVKKAARIEEAEKLWVYGRGQIAGFLIAFIIVIFIGAFLASFFGRALWHMFERTFMKVPVIRAVYPHIKQVTDFFLARKKFSFSKIVAIEFPRKGMWSVGMVTGPGLKKLAPDETELLTVFIPTAPSPINGFLVIAQKSDVVELDLTFEEVVRFVVSVGVIGPEDIVNGKLAGSENLH